MSKKMRIALSGIGNRALPKKTKGSSWSGWVELIKRSDIFQLVAAHDVSEESIKRIIEREYLGPSQVYKDLDSMLEKVACDAILISNPAEHHAITIRKALEFNLHLLIEKPFVNDLEQGRRLVDLINKKGVVASVVQNWRYKDSGRLLYEAIQSGMLGRIGHIFFRYVRDRENPNYPAYIFEEKYPLLYAMGIHHLDLFRYLLQDEYESVSVRSFKPSWSLYKSDTGLNIFLKTKGEIAIVYSGTISSRNSFLPQEFLLIEGEKGSISNESQWLEPPLWFYPAGKKEKINLTPENIDLSITGQYNRADEAILKNFYNAILGKEKVFCTAEDALKSVAVLEASRISCETGKVVFVDQI